MAQSKVPKPSAVKPSFNMLYAMRLILGVASGVLGELFFTQEPVSFDNTTNGILVAVIVYLLTYYFARYVWYRKMDRQHISKLYTTGIGGFFMLFIFTWILLFTYLSGLV